MSAARDRQVRVITAHGVRSAPVKRDRRWWGEAMLLGAVPYWLRLPHHAAAKLPWKA